MKTDLLILSPTGPEWHTTSRVIDNARAAQRAIRPTMVGEIAGLSVACVLSGKGQGDTAATLQNELHARAPRWVLLVGIAGGIPARGVRRGDLVVPEFVYDIDYGKIEAGEFIRRPNYDCHPDVSLLAYAEALAHDAANPWRDRIQAARPDNGAPTESHARLAYVASGNKVIDDPAHPLLRQLAGTMKEVEAVEMEGSGAAAAVRLAQSQLLLGFLMIRGISDEIHLDGVIGGGTSQRSIWKAYASDVAAEFTRALVHQLAVGLEPSVTMHRSEAATPVPGPSSGVCASPSPMDRALNRARYALVITSDEFTRISGAVRGLTDLDLLVLRILATPDIVPSTVSPSSALRDWSALSAVSRVHVPEPSASLESSLKRLYNRGLLCVHHSHVAELSCLADAVTPVGHKLAAILNRTPLAHADPTGART